MTAYYSPAPAHRGKNEMIEWLRRVLHFHYWTLHPYMGRKGYLCVKCRCGQTKMVPIYD